MARNIDNMTAQNWKQIDTSAIDKVQSSSKNKQLINDIKKIVSSAVISLYGNAQTDDKYIKIVNLIMLRIEAALADLTIDDTDVLNDIQTTLNNKLEEFKTSLSTSENSGVTIDKTTIQEISNSIVEALKINSIDNTDENNADNKALKTSELTDNNVQISKTIDTLNANIAKLEKTIQSGLDIFKNPKLLNSKQFKTFTNLLSNSLKNLNSYVNIVYNQINIGINETVKFQEKIVQLIEDSQKSVKEQIIKFLLVALVALGIVFYVFKDKITKWIKEKLGIDEKDSLLGGLFKKINSWIWQKISDGCKWIQDKIADLFKTVTEKAVALWTEFTENPIKFIVDHIKKFVTSIVEFGQKIWNWITGSKNEVLENQSKELDNLYKESQTDTDEKIKASEKIEAQMFNDLKTGFDTAQKEQLDKFQQTNNEAINSANKATETVNEKVDNAVTTTTQNVNDISNTAQKANTDITQQTNDNLNALQSKVDENISDSTKQLNDNAKAITDEIIKDGAQKPANVDKLTDFANNESGGGITVNQTTQMPNMPNGVDKVQSPDGKIAYTTTEKAKEANEKLNDINKTTNNLNVSANSNSSVNVVKQTVNITNPEDFKSNIQLKNQTIKEYSELIEKLKTAKSNIESNESILNDIKADINSYFSQLNSTTDTLKNMQANKQKPSSSVVVVNNGDRKTDAAKEDM